MRKITPFMLAALLLCLNSAPRLIAMPQICQSIADIENHDCYGRGQSSVRDKHTSCHQEGGPASLDRSRETRRACGTMEGK